MKTLEAIQSISYNFVWGRLREVAWKGIVFPSFGGGLNLWCYLEVQLATSIEREVEFGTTQGYVSIGCIWGISRGGHLRKRTQGMMIHLIGEQSSGKETNDRQCFCSGSNRVLQWKDSNDHLSLVNIWETIRKQRRLYLTRNAFGHQWSQKWPSSYDMYKGAPYPQQAIVERICRQHGPNLLVRQRMFQEILRADRRSNCNDTMTQLRWESTTTLANKAPN